MSTSPQLSWQPSLFGNEEPAVDASFSSLKRIELDPESWVDYAPSWVSGADSLFADLVDRLDWGQRVVRMYERKLEEPRLTSLWRENSGDPLEPPILEEIRRLLSDRYGENFDSVGFNLYRDGRDSVAWHGDRIAKNVAQPLVALVSVGEPRKFLMRPKEGGRSRAFALGGGDLLVTGGLSQRTWQHSVPKVASAGPRISIAFRHRLEVAVTSNLQATEE
jgi:alkylated DNA repair dioxygenase AlkB